MDLGLHIPFTVMYNWPAGKASIRLEHSNIPSSYMVRVFAESKSAPGEFYTLKELADKNFSYSDLVKFFRESGSQGKYLHGDIFYIELLDQDNKTLGGGKIDTTNNWPTNGSGSSVVITQYDLKI